MEKTMSRGLGRTQLWIKATLTLGSERFKAPARFADLRDAAWPLSDYDERSLKRALKSLVDRGDVVIVSGRGGVLDPYRYMTVEAFASMTGEKPRDAAHAKAIVARLVDAVDAVTRKPKRKPKS
jgi:hypothetical protein